MELANQVLVNIDYKEPGENIIKYVSPHFYLNKKKQKTIKMIF